MKTNSLHSKLLAAIALALGTGLAVPAALAGPASESGRPCADARLVAVTETKTILSNGRGPTRTVEIGKKFTCTACDTPAIIMKPSGHNGRGVMGPVAIKGTHDCSKGCAPVASTN